MNERLKQLAIEAKLIAPEYNGFDHTRLSISQQKFAELIVGHAIECVRDVLRDENSDLSYAAASQVQNKIKQFFGIEE